MPEWFSDELASFVVFAVVKFFGYTLAAGAIANWYKSKRNVLAVGTTRTIIGLIGGFAYYSLFSDLLNTHGRDFPFAYYAGLFPLRLVEWGIIVFGFFDRKFLYPLKDFGVILVASMWSYVCDIPAAVSAVISIGGIC